jgi:hypothetical protein
VEVLEGSGGTTLTGLGVVPVKVEQANKTRVGTSHCSALFMAALAYRQEQPGLSDPWH